MVSKFRSANSLVNILRYNEQKVDEGKAVLIGGSGYGKGVHELDFHEKLYRLTDLASRNGRTRKHAVHISLNFSRSDRLNEEILNMIAHEYLDKMGLGEQPFLVYHHLDSGHPHIHLVTTNIDPTGRNIDIHFAQISRSFYATKDLEKKFGLRVAERQHKITGDGRLVPVIYGKCEIKSAVSAIVIEVLENYRVTSLAELNAVLGHYNVLADRGSVNSGMYANNGLIYQVIRGGKRVGVPVKASNIAGKPTLKTLEELFLKNEVSRKVRKDTVRKLLDSVLMTSASEGGFLQALRSKGITVILRHTEQGRLDGVTYIDDIAGVVFNGNELGKGYEATTLGSRFSDFKGVLKQLSISADIEPAGGKLRLCYTSAIPDHQEHIWDDLTHRKKMGLKI